MTPQQLAEAHATAIRKHYRKLEDQPGRVHAELLADLAAIAEQHATDAFAGAVDRQVRVADDTGHPVRPDGTVIPETPAAATRRAARVRGESTTTRLGDTTMASVPPITVPIVAEPFDKPMFAAKGLKCCPCLDNAIINDTPMDDVPAAVTMAPSVQTFTMPGQQIMAPIVLPVCVDCRKRQMGVASKTGLVVA